MPDEPAALSLSDILGLGRLAAEGAAGVTGLVEEMHMAILDTPGLAAGAGYGRRCARRLSRGRRRAPADRAGARRRRGPRRVPA